MPFRNRFALSRFKDPKNFSNLMITPLQIVMNFTAMIPFVITWYIGLTDWIPQNTPNWWQAEFLGFANFVRIAGDEYFINAVLRTLLIVGVCTTIEFLLGFGIAYVLSGEFFGKRAFTLACIAPMMVVPAAGGYIFYLMFVETGPINGLLSAITGAPSNIPFLTNSYYALLSLMIADIWQWTPFILLIMVAALTSLPQDPINAAHVLGASKFYTFTHVIVPMLRRPMLIAIILRGIESFKIFDVAYIMTAGGPGRATQTISMYLYESGFLYLKYGFTASECLLIFITMGIIGWYVVKILR